MGLLKLFTGKSPADYERSGDALADNQAWGDAKLAYESALDKLSKQSPANPVLQHRLQQKIHHSKESLAQAQHQEAMALMEAGCTDEALEFFSLALELTANPQLKSELSQHIQSARDRVTGVPVPTMVFHPPPEEADTEFEMDDSDDHFDILLAALPEEVQYAYRSYGYHFQQGYLALNQGAFDQAVEHLTQAAEENPSSHSLVPLELATAYVNMGQAQTAQTLLEAMIQNRPDLLPAIQLLCEIYWEDNAFDQAMALLDTLAPEQAQSMGAYLLRGETLLQAARYNEAESFFQELLETHGWNDKIAIGQARAFEGLDRLPQARDLYGQIISQCSGCGTHIDPSLKRKYADLSLATGHDTTKVLENYLSLAQEDPANAVQYYQKISSIYLDMGNETESVRFQSIAEALSREQRS